MHMLGYKLLSPAVHDEQQNIASHADLFVALLPVDHHCITMVKVQGPQSDMQTYSNQNCIFFRRTNLPTY